MFYLRTDLPTVIRSPERGADGALDNGAGLPIESLSAGSRDCQNITESYLLFSFVLKRLTAAWQLR
jgi:hypothetical protein